MKSRKLGIALLIMLAFVVTTGTFAYWASSVAGSNDTATATVAIGSGDAVTTTVTVNNQTNGGLLVPVGYEGGADVNNVDLTFPVLWESDNIAAGDALTGTLSVNIDSIEINSVDYSGLFTVTVSSGTGAITEDASQDVVINVEFTNEPADANEYNAVATENLVVTLTFTVVPD